MDLVCGRDAGRLLQDVSYQDLRWPAFMLIMMVKDFTNNISRVAEKPSGRGLCHGLCDCKTPRLALWLLKRCLLASCIIQCVYTVLVVTMNIVVHRDTNLMEPKDIPKLTPESIKDRIYGSKMVLVVEQCMIATVWGCKICLLLFYRKLT